MNKYNKDATLNLYKSTVQLCIEICSNYFAAHVLGIE